MRARGAAAVAKVSARDALAAAREIGTLVTQAVRQVLRGTAEGIEEVVKSHRAAKRSSSARLRDARKDGGRAARTAC